MNNTEAPSNSPVAAPTGSPTAAIGDGSSGDEEWMEPVLAAVITLVIITLLLVGLWCYRKDRMTPDKVQKLTKMKSICLFLHQNDITM